MSETAPAAGTPKRILCLLNDGPDPDARRWIEALSRNNEVEVVDLANRTLSYVEIVERIFAANRVISW